MGKRRLYLLKKSYGDFIVVGWAKYRRHQEYPYRLQMHVHVLLAFDSAGLKPKGPERLWSLVGTGRYEWHAPHLDNYKSRHVRRLHVL